MPRKSPISSRKRTAQGSVGIAPDLERRTKGEHGRRGLVDAPYGYYLQLADVALDQKPANPVRHVPEQLPEVSPIFVPAMPVVSPESLPPFPAAPAPRKPGKLVLPKPA